MYPRTSISLGSGRIANAVRGKVVIKKNFTSSFGLNSV